LSIYLPRPFAPREPAQVARLIAEHPFATLITPADPEAYLSHLPLQFLADRGPQGTLLGHMARANPHWRHFGNGASIAVFHGPHAYISPSWYAEPASAVPTWNYAVAHVYGIVELMDSEREKRALLDDLVARYESSRARPWRLQLEGAALEAMLGAIVGFRLRIERIDAKIKLSQNRSAEDRERVIGALRAEDHEDATATAAWMESYALDR
jgi:transcriptional regulator